MTCPRCSGAPWKASRPFCHDCEEYVVDMGAAETGRDAPTGSDTRLEADIQLAIRRALEALGFSVYDLSQDRATRQTPGLADLYVMGHGRCAWVEVKRPKGRQSEAQVRFEGLVRANGGEYYVWRHEDEAIRFTQDGRAVA